MLMICCRNSPSLPPLGRPRWRSQLFPLAHRLLLIIIWISIWLNHHHHQHDNLLFTIVILANQQIQTTLSSSMINVNRQYSEPPDALIKQDWEKDPWEFPRSVSQSAFDKVDRYLTPLLIRHHLKFFGILGEGCFGQVRLNRCCWWPDWTQSDKDHDHDELLA